MYNASFLNSLFFIIVSLIFISKEGHCLHQNSQNHKFVQKSIVAPSHGFSTGKQQISPLACYNVKTLPATQSKSIVNLNEGLTYEDLVSSFHLQASVKIPFLFASSISASYLTSIQDTDFSLSVSYYQYIEADVDVQFGYGPDAALTKDGLLAYQNGNNPQFGLICGDKVFDSYKVGAMLIMSLNFQFRNHQQKSTFSSGLGATFESFASISLKVESIASSQNIKGSVSVKAFQTGGNPSQLGQILNSKCGDHYCTSSCDMQNMKNCSFAVDGLINYAMKNMPSQVSVQKNKGMTSFPIQFANLIQIKWLGLTQPISVITPSTQEARLSLVKAYQQNKYYMQKIHVLLDKYPVPWDVTRNIHKAGKLLYNKVTDNLRILNDPDRGAIICYSDPQNCQNKAYELLSKLKFVQQSDLYFLRSIKYRYSIAKSIYFYRFGDKMNAWNFTADSQFCNVTKNIYKPTLKANQNISYSRFQYVCSKYSYMGFCKAIIPENQFKYNQTMCNITSLQICKEIVKTKKNMIKQYHQHFHNKKLYSHQQTPQNIPQLLDDQGQQIQNLVHEGICQNNYPQIFVQSKPDHKRQRLNDSQIGSFMQELELEEQLPPAQGRNNVLFTVSQYYFESYSKNQTDQKPDYCRKENKEKTTGIKQPFVLPQTELLTQQGNIKLTQSQLTAEQNLQSQNA